MAFCAWRASAYRDFWSKSLWALETALYGVLVVAYATRLPAVSHARGWRALVAPYVIASLPFVVFVLPVNVAALPQTFVPGQALLVIGTLLTVTAMATLGRSFSISVEARRPVTRGVYRFVRHPVYLGEMVALLGVALIRLSPLSLALTAAFWVLQALRARWEDEALVGAFPAHASYVDRVGRFGLRQGRPRADSAASPDA
ncbi:MAG: isoprenylcysteine carboxylmethyltransferase family protein [Proteobacteria bacterium]|nr:isoprenylcysteine carboxylmethyltransferase family protein [Pseudomonadota bacterium]